MDKSNKIKNYFVEENVEFINVSYAAGFIRNME